MKISSLLKIGVILCLFYNTFLFADLDTLWTKTYGGTNGEQGKSVQQTTDNGYIVTGSNPTNSGDVWLLKTDENGDTLWTKTYGLAWSDKGNCVQQTTDNGYIITGSITPAMGSFPDIWLLKTDENGDTLWTKTFNQSGNEVGNCVQQTTDDGYIITGYTKPTGINYRVWLIKTDEDGNATWTRSYGGTDNDQGNWVQQTNDTGYIITGSTKSFGDSNQVYLIKTDDLGDTMWTKTYGGTRNEIGYSVQQTNDNGYIITGSTNSFGAGNYDIYLIKTDENGDTLWTKTYGGTGSDIGYSVQQTIDNGYIITGGIHIPGNYELCVIKTDENGNALWTKTYGGPGSVSDYGYSIQETGDNEYIITGLIGTNNGDLWLLRMAPAPEFSVTPTSIDFGNVYVDSSKTNSVTVTNTGGATLNITSTVSDNSEFTVTPTTGSLAPAESKLFYITFAPTDFGVETGNIIFIHNANSSPDTVTVTGLGAIVGAAPEIQSVIDMPNDQGRWVRITWQASIFDRLESVNPITQYGIWRRIDDYGNSFLNQKRGDILEGWDCVGTVPAIQDTIYNFVSPTLADSNVSGMYYSVFIITAHTQDPILYYVSDPDSGYSVDNIPPEAPCNLAGEVIDNNVFLTWEILNLVYDFSYFAIYRDTISGFIPGDNNRIGTSNEPTYTDSSVSGTYYYVVSAFDVNGNESDYSNEIGVVTGIADGYSDKPMSFSFCLRNNPVKGKALFNLALPEAATVTLSIYDVTGRLVDRMSDRRSAGYYEIPWISKVTAGIYFYKLQSPWKTEVGKLVIIH
jgi:hypothetical protein